MDLHAELLEFEEAGYSSEPEGWPCQSEVVTGCGPVGILTQLAAPGVLAQKALTVLCTVLHNPQNSP